jgi:hypothetical protein
VQANRPEPACCGPGAGSTRPRHGPTKWRLCHRARVRPVSNACIARAEWPSVCCPSCPRMRTSPARRTRDTPRPASAAGARPLGHGRDQASDDAEGRPIRVPSESTIRVPSESFRKPILATPQKGDRAVVGRCKVSVGEEARPLTGTPHLGPGRVPARHGSVRAGSRPVTVRLAAHSLTLTNSACPNPGQAQSFRPHSVQGVW